MEENDKTSTEMSGKIGNNPQIPAMKVTVFSHLPEKIEIVAYGRTYYKVKHYSPIYEDVHIILETIRQEKFKDTIMQLRSLYGITEYGEKKKELPIVLFNGSFSEFSKAGFISSSGLFILDFDHIPDSEMGNVWNMLANNEYVFSAWTSPSGHGYKVLVKVLDDNDEDIHKEYFAALSKSTLFPIDYIDKSGSDICRCCFFSSDPNLYLNDNSKVWTQRGIINKPIISSPYSPVNLDDTETSKIISFLEIGWNKSFPMNPGNRHDSSFLRAREMAEWGIEEDNAMTYMLGFEESDFCEDEIRRQINSAYKKTKEAGKIGCKYRKLL